jgi:hypothetical protein
MVLEWNHEESMVSSLRGEPGSFLCARPFPVDARTVWPSALPQTVVVVITSWQHHWHHRPPHHDLILVVGVVFFFCRAP